LKNLLANQDVGAALVNSFKYAILLTIVSMVICSLAGYGFEIYHDKAKDAVMGVILLAMMVPFITILVPLFQMVAKMKMLNTYVGIHFTNGINPIFNHDVSAECKIISS